MSKNIAHSVSSHIVLPILASLSFLTSCEQRIDASDEESLKASIQKISAKLTTEEKENFQASCIIVAIDGAKYNKQEPWRLLDNKTVAEVNAIAESIAQRNKAARKNEEIQQITAKINELKDQEQRNSENLKKRNNIIITNAIFRIEADRFRDYPVLSFCIRNSTQQTISGIGFKAVLTSEGREVPWVEDSFFYAFPGGLNPGEEQKLDLSPNRFSEWGNLTARNDFQLEITLEKIKDAREEEIWQVYENATEERIKCEAQLRELQNSL